MRLSYLLLAPILAFSASAQLGSPDYGIQGCLDVGAVTQPLLAAVGGAVVADNSPRTDSACATQCRSQGRSYAFFLNNPISLTLLGAQITTQCTCSNTAPTLSQLVSANAAVNAATGAGICATAGAEAIRVTTDFNLRACVGLNALTNTDAGSTTQVTTVQQCIDRCTGGASTAYAIVDTIAKSCTCAAKSQLLTGAQTGLCGTAGGRNAVYLNNNLVQPSGGLRRRSFERQKVIGLCPTGLQACLVGDESAVGSSAFECLDTRAELESCGGCTQGYADTTVGASTVGTDLPGVALGGSTCTLGKCEIFACKKGHNLVNGRCLRA